MRKQADSMSNGKDAGSEIERKYLVRAVPNLEGVKRQEVLQGYMAVDADGTEVRLRRIGGRYVETVKTGAGLKRGEIEIDITPEQFNALWPSTENRRVEKTRYEIEYAGCIIELDLYSGGLAGLQVAEVEFDSEDASAAFTPPDWFGREITEDSAFKNRNLAMHGAPRETVPS